jgi:hypothetical protein
MGPIANLYKYILNKHVYGNGSRSYEGITKVYRICSDEKIKAFYIGGVLIVKGYT